MENLIYLDNNATTPLDPRVLDAMMPFFTRQYANAASNHEFGHQAKDSVTVAREQVASLIKSGPHEIIFTSGATEGINLAIKGVADYYQDKGKHIVTASTEHTAVLDVCRFLESKGYEVTYLGVNKDGLIDLEELRSAIRSDTILVSIMLVNNETGVIQPIKEISDIAHENGSFFLTDATQAVGKMPVDVNEMGIDLMAFSGHKFYGPKGIGGLYVRSRRPFKVKLDSLIHGGGHERNMRSGTLNVPGIIGLGKAAEIAKQDMQEDANRIKTLRDTLEQELLNIPDSYINGDLKQRLYNTCNICFKGVDADAIMVGLKDIMVSNGSACTSTEIKPSHVLIAMEHSEQDAYSSLRISLGRFTLQLDIEKTISRIKRIVENLLAMNV